MTASVGSRLLPNRGMRIGVGMLSIGLVGLAGFAVINSQTANVMEGGPGVIVGGIGLLGLFGGVILSAVSLVWLAASRWRPTPTA